MLHANILDFHIHSIERGLCEEVLSVCIPSCLLSFSFGVLRRDGPIHEGLGKNRVDTVMVQ